MHKSTIVKYFLFRFLLPSVMIVLFNGCNSNKPAEDAQKDAEVSYNEIPVLSCTAAEAWPHDTTSFTQGLFFYNGQLYESTGSPSEIAYTRSWVGIQDTATGKPEIKAELDRQEFFGEGITVLDEKLYQLTYKNQICFVYDINTFAPLGRFRYENKEGWGLTNDGVHLIMSDGSHTLTWMNPVNFAVEKSLVVTENGMPVNNLNELELVNGAVYANIWMTAFIVKIDTASGKVTAKIDLSDLYKRVKQQHPGAAEMNGIAWHPGTDKLYITGKLWPWIYRLDINQGL